MADPQWEETTAVADAPTWDETMSGEDVLSSGFKASEQGFGQAGRLLRAGALASPEPPLPKPPKFVHSKYGPLPGEQPPVLSERLQQAAAAIPPGTGPITRPASSLARSALQMGAGITAPENLPALAAFTSPPGAAAAGVYYGVQAIRGAGQSIKRIRELMKRPGPVDEKFKQELSDAIVDAEANVAVAGEIGGGLAKGAARTIPRPVAREFGQPRVPALQPLEFTGTGLPGLPRGATPIRPTAGPEVLGPPVPPLNLRTMPESAVTEAESGRELNQLQEIRDKGLRTRNQVLANFPALRQFPNASERAAALLRQAYPPAVQGPPIPPGGVPRPIPVRTGPEQGPLNVVAGTQPVIEPMRVRQEPVVQGPQIPEAVSAQTEREANMQREVETRRSALQQNIIFWERELEMARNRGDRRGQEEAAGQLMLFRREYEAIPPVKEITPKPPIARAPASAFPPTVPTTAPEPERGESVIEEIRRKNLRTRQQVINNFPGFREGGRSGERAAELLRQAWGTEKPAPTPPKAPPEEPPAAPPAAPVPKPPAPPAAPEAAQPSPEPLETPPSPTPEAPSPVPEAPVEPAKPETIEDTPLAGKTLGEWEAVKDASQLPKGNARSELAKWLAVPNQPSRILQALGNKRRTREIHAPPVTEVAPVAETIGIPGEIGKPSFAITLGDSGNWREVFEREQETARKNDILRRVADHSKSGTELADVVDRVESMLKAGEAPDVANTLWAVSRNPRSEDTLKARALKLREEIFDGKYSAPEPPQSQEAPVTVAKPEPAPTPPAAPQGPAKPVEAPAAPQLPKLVSDALARSDKDAGWVWMHSTPEEKAAVDKWLVDTKHSSASQPGTPEGRFKALVAAEEAKGKPSMGPGAAASAEFTARENRRRLLSNITERLFGSRAGEVADAFLRKVAGEAVPKTMALSGEAGNKMVRFASANIAAPLMARSMAVEVLGDKFPDENFRERLGAVLVEDRLRAIRRGIEEAADREKDPDKQQVLVDQAADVNTLVGEGRYFPSETAFNEALRNPDIAQAIKNHKQTIQPEAERYHTEADGQLAGPGVNTGAFINLLPLFQENPEAVFTSARKGDYTRPFKRRSVFSRRAKGTAQRYELDYLPLAERMIRANYEEFTKRQLYDQLQEDRLGVVLAPNVARPTFDGKPAEKFQIKRQTLVVPSARGTQVIPQYENLWVHPDIAPELRQAENLGNPISNAAIARIANVLNRIQLAGPTDAVWHIANMMSTIAGSQGGGSFMADIARKMPLVNVVDAAVRITSAAKRVLQDDPDTMRQIAELSQIGAVRAERPGASITSRVINLLDKAGRSVRDDMYRNLVQRGLVEDSEVGRREFVNQLGQYNPRIMGQIESFFKEAGLSPFVVAGRNFNRMALRRIALSPGIKAANLQSAIQMRAIEATGVIATLVAVPALLNTLSTGRPTGRPGIPYGAIDTGVDDKNGKHVYIDPAQWIGLRRGMRLTGINALTEGLMRHQPSREIGKQAIHDIIGAAVHPWAGPVVQTPFIGATGYTTSFYRESRDPGDYWQNFLAALRNINPLVHGYFQKQGPGIAGGIQSAEASLSSAAGIKARTPLSAVNQIHELANSWASRSTDPAVRSNYEQHAKESFSSQYTELRGALGRNDMEGARKAYQELRANGKTPSRIRETLNHPHPFAGSARLEARFLHSLTPEQRQVYQEAMKERRTIANRLNQVLRTPNQ